MTFGERLALARKEKGYTQEQLASLIGIAKSTLTGYEKGNREPDILKIKKIIEILNIDADYLLGIDFQEKSKIDNTPLNTKLALDIFEKLNPEFQICSIHQMQELFSLQQTTISSLQDRQE